MVKSPPRRSSPRAAVSCGQKDRVFFCPLFEHQKVSTVCTVLRGKRICRVDCGQYFRWAGENPERVREILRQYHPLIARHLIANGRSTTDILANVLPRGGHICSFCGKAYKHAGALSRHRLRRHRRALAEESTP